MRAALADILQAFSQALLELGGAARLDHCLWGHDDPALFELDLEVVAGRKPKLVVDLLWDDHLTAETELDVQGSAPQDTNV